ncbi:MAG: hypothetical protein Q8N56_02975 [bacterium]|nr:hypothetical protein [bacterium]
MRKVEKIILIIAGIALVSLVIIHLFYLDLVSSPGYGFLSLLVMVGGVFLMINYSNPQYPLPLRIIGLIVYILWILFWIYLKKVTKGAGLT